LAVGSPEMRKSGPYILGTVPNFCPTQILGQSGPGPGQFGTRPKNDQTTSFFLGQISWTPILKNKNGVIWIRGYDRILKLNISENYRNKGRILPQLRKIAFRLCYNSLSYYIKYGENINFIYMKLHQEMYKNEFLMWF